MFLRKVNIFKSYTSVMSKNYFIVYFIYFTFFLFNGPFERIIPLFFEKQGHTELYGFFLSILTIIHIVLPGLVSYLAHKYNSFSISIFAMFLSFIGAFLAGLLSSSYFYYIPLLLLIICGRTIFNYSLGNSINYVLPSENRGKYFAFRDIFLFGAISIGLFLGGVYTSKFDVNSFYMVFSFGFFIPLFFIAWAEKRLNFSNVKEQSKEQTNEDKKEPKIDEKMDNDSKINLFKDKIVWAFLLINVGTIIYGTAMKFLPLLGTSIGISVPAVMTMFGAVTIVNSCIALIIGYFSDLSGRKWLYVFDLGFDMLPALVFAFTQNITLFIVGIVLTMVKDAFAPISFAYFFDCFPESKGVLIMGTLSSIGNAISFFAPIVVGILWAISPKSVFLIGAAGNIFAAVVAAIMLPNVKNQETQKISV